MVEACLREIREIGATNGAPLPDDAFILGAEADEERGRSTKEAAESKRSYGLMDLLGHNTIRTEYQTCFRRSVEQVVLSG